MRNSFFSPTHPNDPDSQSVNKGTGICKAQCVILRRSLHVLTFY